MFKLMKLSTKNYISNKSSMPALKFPKEVFRLEGKDTDSSLDLHEEIKYIGNDK